jgi:hypothetical protein
MNYALRIPDYYKSDIEDVKGEVSMNQFIVNAIAEKVATLKTLDYLTQRAEDGSRDHAISILKRASTHKPEPEDTL